MSEGEMKIILTVPKWDRKVDTCSRYLSQIEALAKFYDCSNAMEAFIMATCPTKSEFEMIDLATNDAIKKALRKIYNANKRMMAIMTLGMESSHGLMVIQKTKSPDFPQGKPTDRLKF